MQTMYLALGIFLLTYVLMLTLQKYRPTIALSSALLFIVPVSYTHLSSERSMSASTLSRSGSETGTARYQQLSCQ